MPMGPIDYSGLGGDTNGVWVAQDMPTGATDGVNTVFLLTDLPKMDSEIIRKNGLVLVRNWDYTIVGDMVTVMTPPLSTDYLTASYFK